MMWNSTELATTGRINRNGTPFAKINGRQLCRRARASLVWSAVAVLTVTWAREVHGLPAESQRFEPTALRQYLPPARDFDLGEMASESAPQTVQPTWADGKGLRLAQEKASNAEELRQALEQEQQKAQALSQDNADAMSSS